MPEVFKYNPSRISDKVEGRFPLRLVRLCLMELRGLVTEHVTILGTGSGGSGGGSGGGGTSTTARRFVVRWVANGPYRVDTAVDGAWVVPEDCTISALYLWRGTAGRSGSTIIDLNRNGTSIYSNTANRPTLAYTDDVTACNLPDVVSLVAEDVITIDCDERETGHPYNFTLTLEAV